jgi:hypothetical protein
MAIAEALAERQDGGLSPATRTRGGDLICQLYGLRRFLIVDLPNFDSVAREHGTAALRACDVPPATADLLASEVLDLLGKVVRARRSTKATRLKSSGGLEPLSKLFCLLKYLLLL